MWITKKENGKGTRYLYRERFQDESTGKYISLSVTLNSRNAHTQKVAAQLLRDKFEKMQDNGQTEQAARIQALTLETVLREWQEITDMRVKPNTHVNHDLYIRKILAGLPQHILFKDFTASVAEKLLFRYYYLDKLSFNYCKSLQITVKAAMRYAKKAGYIQDISDFEEITLKRRAATAAELEKSNDKFLDRDELKNCLDQLKEKNFRVGLAMEFISLTGLRCGELLALRRQDLDLDKRELSVTGTIVGNVKNGEEIQRGTPKTRTSYRTIDLSLRAVQILEWFITDNKRLARWGKSGNSLCTNYKDRGYIFTTDTGYPLDRHYINRLLREIKIPGKRISSHIFRHTHISMLAAMGVPVKAIMQRVGHSDPKVTLSVYTHVTQEMKDKLDSCLEQITV